MYVIHCLVWVHQAVKHQVKFEKLEQLYDPKSQSPALRAYTSPRQYRHLLRWTRGVSVCSDEVVLRDTIFSIIATRASWLSMSKVCCECATYKFSNRGIVLSQWYLL